MQNFKIYLNQLKEDDKALVEILEVIKLEKQTASTIALQGWFITTWVNILMQLKCIRKR